MSGVINGVAERGSCFRSFLLRFKIWPCMFYHDNWFPDVSRFFYGSCNSNSAGMRGNIPKVDTFRILETFWNHVHWTSKFCPSICSNHTVQAAGATFMKVNGMFHQMKQRHGKRWHEMAWACEFQPCSFRLNFGSLWFSGDNFGHSMLAKFSHRSTTKWHSTFFISAAPELWISRRCRWIALNLIRAVSSAMIHGQTIFQCVTTKNDYKFHVPLRYTEHFSWFRLPTFVSENLTSWARFYTWYQIGWRQL